MLLETTYENIVTKQNHKKKKAFLKCKCDNSECGKIIIKELGKIRRGQTKHFCSHSCKSSSIRTGKYARCVNPTCTNSFWQESRTHSPKPARRYCSFKCSNYMTDCSEKDCNKQALHRSKSGLCLVHIRKVTYKKHKKGLFSKLGNKCANCGEKDSMYFEVDHINNDGFKYRNRQKKSKERHNYWTKLINIVDETPPIIQILCCNCNQAKARNHGVLYKPTKFTRRSTKQREVTNGFKEEVARRAI